MRRLVPQAILELADTSRRQALVARSLRAAVLVVDIAGFTRQTEQLLQLGPRSVERIAAVVRGAFVPMVEAIEAHGGFVTMFAGDSIVALFPGEDRPARARADRAAASMQEAFRSYVERAGFPLQLRAGAAYGGIDANLVFDPTTARRAYWYSGATLGRALRAEHEASPGALAWADGGSEPGAEDAGPVQLSAAADEAQLSASFFPGSLLGLRTPGQLRHVVSVFVSIVGTVGTPDAATIHAVLLRVFALQASFGGILRQIEYGQDATRLLLYWGAPQARDEDVQLALGFCLQLRERCSAALRIAAAHGLVYAGFVGADEGRAEYAAYGTSVNLAARLSNACEVGSILLDERLAERAAGFRLQLTAPRRLRGFEGERKVYELRGLAERTRQLAPPVGQRALLQRVQDYLLGPFAADGGIVLVGEPGVGKSHLARCAREALPGTCLEHACQALERRAFSVPRGLLARWANVSALDDAASGAELLRAALERQADLQLMAALPYLAALLDCPIPGSAWHADQPQERFARTQQALARWLGLLAQPTSGVAGIFIEDAQWMDPESEALFEQVFADAGGLRVLVTARPEWKPWPGLRVEPVAALDAEGVAALLAQTLGGTPEPDLVEWMYARTRGNPLFTTQLAVHARELGAVITCQGRTALASMQQLTESLPVDLHSALVSRIDALPDVSREVVRAAAVLAPSLSMGLLSAVCGPELDVQAGVDAAVERGILTPQGTTGYAFCHVLLADAAYSLELDATLAPLHRRAARALAASGEHLDARWSEIARHHLAAGEAPQAARAWHAAARVALRAGRSSEAADHVQTALTRIQPLAAEDELPLMIALALARIVTHGPSAELTRRAWLRARELTGEAAPTAEGFQALFGLRTHALFAGEHERSFELAQRCAAVAERSADPLCIEQAQNMLGNACFWRGELSEAVRLLESLPDQLDPAHHERHLMQFAQNPYFTSAFPLLLSLLGLGEVMRALHVADDRLEKAQLVGHPFAVVLVLFAQASLLAHCGQAEQAAAVAQELESLAESGGVKVYVPLSRVVSCWASAARGSRAAAAELQQTAQQLMAAGVQCGHSGHLVLLADAWLRCDERARARAALQEARAWADMRAEHAFEWRMAQLEARLRARGEDDERDIR